MPSRDYSKAQIYKLTCLDPTVTDIYIGSTTNFKHRNWQHKHSCKQINGKSYNLKVYKFIRDNGGYSNWKMVWIKDFPCSLKKELEAEEYKIMKEMRSTLNTYGDIVNIETKKIRGDKYQKEYHIKNKVKRGLLAKKIYENNKEHYIEYKHEWYEQNKAKNQVKITCPCGVIVSKGCLTRHKKSKKHQQFLSL